MATDVVIKSFDSLQEDLNKAKSNLKGLNENIRRIIGRDPTEENARNDRNVGRKRNFTEANRRQNNNEIDRTRYRELSPPAIKIKRAPEAKSVFSRLSGHAFRDEENTNFKPRIFSRVIKELPTREEIVEAQCMDEESRARNRRMFGCLLGTLQKFCQEESRLKPKEEKKAMVEKKLEEQERKEREVLRKERQILFIDRKRQQLEIRKLEAKMVLVEEFQMWEKAKRSLMNHVRTKTKPPIYFKPKTINEKVKKLLHECQTELEKEIKKKIDKLNEQILELDDRYRLRDDEIQFMKSTDEGRKLLDGTETRYYQRTGDKTDSDGEEDEFDSNYESDGREFNFAGNDRKYSRSVVVTVQNNYNKINKNSILNDDYQYNDNILIENSNSNSFGRIDNLVKEEKDNDSDGENNKLKNKNNIEIESNDNDNGVNNNICILNSIKIKREKDQKID